MQPSSNRALKRIGRLAAAYSRVAISIPNRAIKTSDTDASYRRSETSLPLSHPQQNIAAPSVDS
eukprot:6178146-Pleurochrysis_carterae.AAC.1